MDSIWSGHLRYLDWRHSWVGSDGFEQRILLNGLLDDRASYQTRRSQRQHPLARRWMARPATEIPC